LLKIIQTMQTERFINENEDSSDLLNLAGADFGKENWDYSNQAIIDEIIESCAAEKFRENSREIFSYKFSSKSPIFKKTKKSQNREKTTQTKVKKIEESEENKFNRKFTELQKENADLLVDFKNELEGAKQVEVKMAEISNLMSLFSNEVTEQHNEMESIYDSAVLVHRALKKGGEHLSEAKERRTAFRKFYVTFMLAMTLSLIFLHLQAP